MLCGQFSPLHSLKTKTMKHIKGYSEETVFCVKYLKERGFLSEDKLDEIAGLIDELGGEFKFMKVKQGFYTELATKLRELWPSGEKDGKYPWRDSVTNLARRLETMWAARNLGEIPIEVCLTAARRYLAQYENNTKYMMTLKYFILKQGKITEDDGNVKLLQKSQFADMIESLTEEDKQQAEWENAFESSNTIFQGNLI